MAGTTTWRDIPVFEAILRITRAHRVPTPETIAEEALLHLGDVYDAIAILVSLDYVRIGSTSGEADSSDIAVRLNERLHVLLRPVY